MRYTDSPQTSSRLSCPWFLPVLAAVGTVLGSCSPSTTLSGGGSESLQRAAEPSGDGDLQVITTFLPITQFTKAVAGDRAEVTQLLPLNMGPHDYQASPEDVQRLTQADVLVQNGLGFEEFLEDLVENAVNPNLKIIDSSQGVAAIAYESLAGESHAEEHGHAEEAHAEEHGHQGDFNPHVWLDPKRAVQQVETIRDGLIAADPAGEPDYTANAAAYVEKLRQLDAEIATTLKPYADQTFVALHDFAPYFAQSYGLKAEFLVDVPEDNPSPNDVKRISDQVNASNLKTILTEPQAGDDPLAALANDLNVTISEFDPMETGSATALEPDYYFITMRQNVKSLVAAFGGLTQSVLPLWMSRDVAARPQRVGSRF